MNAMAGTSLTGMLMAMAIGATLLGSAVPAMGALQQRNERAATNNALMASLALARSEALRRGTDIVICPAEPLANGCRNDGAWHHGWMVFVDSNRNGRYDASDALLHMQGKLDAHTRLDSGVGRPRVRYAANGMNRGSNLSIRMCQKGQITSAIVINNAGRARLETSAAALRQWRCGV